MPEAVTKTSRPGRPGAARAPRTPAAPGDGIESYGFVEGLAGWFFVGVMPKPETPVGEASAFARFERGALGGVAKIAYFDLPGAKRLGRIGVIVFVAGAARASSPLAELHLQFGKTTQVCRAGAATIRADNDALLPQVRRILVESASADATRLALLRLVTRPIYNGEDTVGSLPAPIHLAFDEAIVCPPSGLLLLGWRLGGRTNAYTLRVRSGALNCAFTPEDGYRLPRPDLVDEFGRARGFTDLDAGFIVYLPDAYSAGQATYVEIETTSGHVAFRPLNPSFHTGMAAIRHILSVVAPAQGEFDATFDKTVGPAVAALNQTRLRGAPEKTELVFGKPPAHPTHSLIIPLYGRIDYVEYQVAQFTCDPAAKDWEIIYVLDDPPRRRDLETLARSVYERFRLPLRLVLLTSNLGYAPANNAGLRAARGDYVCFLNSDVFPKTPDWLGRLTKQLEARPDIGVIGARLLYEDGSIQHEGCHFEPLADVDGWSFVRHFNKGRRPDGSKGLRLCDAITGACMTMTRELANQLGGFDEAYVIGDFEDSDLCMKIRQLGRACAVDLDVDMYHLERQSQTAPDQIWRQNLTYYNAWLHQRRWMGAPRAKPAATAGAVRALT